MAKNPKSEIGCVASLYNWLLNTKLNLPIGNGVTVSLLVVVMLLCFLTCCVYPVTDAKLRSAGILPTHAPVPTRTPRPTATPKPTRPTATVKPTRTPKPTRTLWPTSTVAAAATPTPSPAPPATPTAGPSPTATRTPTPEPSNCWAAAFVSDVTIPDNTQLEPGAAFVKTWRIRNTGDCAWTGLTLDHNTGADMGQTTVTVPETAPGATADVSVNLSAPMNPGAYRAGFQVNHDGTALLDLTVVIRSGHPTPVPATAAPVTSAPATEAPATSEPQPQPTAEPTQPPANPPQGGGLADGVWRCPDSTAGAAYVGSDQSDKFHYLDCRHAKKIAAANRLCFRDRAAAVNYNYIPCGVCDP